MFRHSFFVHYDFTVKENFRIDFVEIICQNIFIGIIHNVIFTQGGKIMKKVFSALLAGFFLCLTLTSCALFEKNEEPVTEPHEDTYFMLASLPDIGKYKSTDIKDCYYPSGALDEFKPDDGYGGIVPYCCGIEKYSSADSDEYFIASYGLACTDGRIITHGIYSDVQLLTSSDGKAIYSCTRKSESEESKVFDIITARGSKMVTVETTADAADTFSFYYDFPCECFTVSDINDGVMLFDFNGNMIVNLTEVFGADCYFRVCYCDGEKIIFCASPEAYPYETTADTDFYCVDKKGELLYTLNFGEFAPDSYAGGYLVLRGRDGMRLSDVLGNIITGDKTYENIVYDKIKAHSKSSTGAEKQCCQKR